MPPELLPEVPDLERLGRLFEMRTGVEIYLRKLIMMYLGIKSNWDNKKLAEAMMQGLSSRSDRPKPSELFVGRTPQQVANDLYTLDLKKIVLHNWDVFSPLFENNKSRFDMNMDAINKARRVDSHTKPVTDDEMVAFENSYHWVLGRIKKVPGIVEVGATK